MGYTSSGSKRTHLVIGQIARHITERLTATMTADDRRLADFQSIIEALLASMTQIYHDAQAVHLLDDLLAKTAHTIVSIAATGTIANIIIPIMAERNIDDATLSKMLHVGKVVSKRQSVLYTEHDTLSSLPLVAIEVGRRTGDTQVIAILTHNSLYLVKDQVGILGRTSHIKIYLAAEGLTQLRLRQVSHHRRCILMTVGHFMQIYQNTGVAMVETDTLREEHRRIAMCIKNKDALMQLLRLIKLGSLSSKPLEYLQSVFLQPFRMPLHTEDRLVLATFHSLYDAISRFGDAAQFISRHTHSLMMEGVDKNLLAIIYIK